MLNIEMGDKHIISRVIDDFFKNPRFQAQPYSKNKLTSKDLQRKNWQCDQT
jgi:hypothetical protein